LIIKNNTAQTSAPKQAKAARGPANDNANTGKGKWWISWSDSIASSAHDAMDEPVNIHAPSRTVERLILAQQTNHQSYMRSRALQKGTD